MKVLSARLAKSLNRRAKRPVFLEPAHRHFRKCLAVCGDGADNGSGLVWSPATA